MARVVLKTVQMFFATKEMNAVKHVDVAKVNIVMDGEDVYLVK
jgi:hypothetical protein